MHISLSALAGGIRIMWSDILPRMTYNTLSSFPLMSSSFQTDSTVHRTKWYMLILPFAGLTFLTYRNPAETCFVVTGCISRTREQLFPWIISRMDCVRRSLYRHRNNKGLTLSFSHAIILSLFAVIVSLPFIRFTGNSTPKWPPPPPPPKKGGKLSASISCIEFFDVWICTSW